MAFQWYPVPSFGGGLNFAADPSRIEDNSWTGCQGIMPEADQAVTAPAWQVYMPGSRWVPASYTPCGWVPDLMNPDVTGAILCFAFRNTPPSETITFVGRYGRGYPSTVVTDAPGSLPITGSADVDVDHLMPPPMTTSAVAAQQLIITGSPGLLNTGAFKYIGDGTIAAISGIYGRHACAAGGHAIIADLQQAPPGNRTVKVSDGGPNPLGKWDPADISTSADFFQVDGGGGIQSVVPVTGGFVVIMQRGLSVAQTTRQIPPFTIDRMQSRGGLGEGALTAIGAVYMTQAGLSDISGNLLAPAVAPFLVANISAPGGGTGVNVIADLAGDGAIVTNLNAPVTVGVKLRTGAAWMHRLPFTPAAVRNALHGTVQMQQMEGFWTDLHAMPPRATVHTVMDAATGNLWSQFDGSIPEPDASVDTKDFCFGANPPDPPTWQSYVDRIKVDWEGTALDVYAAVRNHLGPRTAPYWNLDATIPQTWTKLGTLTQGLSELPVRLRGKYFRFRFAMGATVAPFRVRGFSLRYLPASDRRWDH